MFSRASITVAVLAVVMGLASMASAQVINSGAQTITLNATLAESLTLSLSGNSVNFTLAAGSATNAGSTTITANTAWVLKPGRTAVNLYAYFASTNALTDGAGNNIPTSAFFIADGAGPSTAVTSSTANTAGFGAAGAGLTLGAATAITGANKSGSRSDVLAFNINLTGGTLPQLPAATYTGTLNIQAQATP